MGVGGYLTKNVVYIAARTDKYLAVGEEDACLVVRACEPFVGTAIARNIAGWGI